MQPKFGKDDLMSMLEPWYESLKDPGRAQEQVRLDLVRTYAETEYGKENSALEVDGVGKFRESFPIMDYERLKGYLEEVKKGNYKVFLPEPPVCWVMTRGSTGAAKILPVTATHLEQILACGARALVNYVVRKRDQEMFSGKILNLNFPSRVSALDIGDRSVDYGYSSGTYARFFPSLGNVGLVPLQEEIDSLGAGITKADWERRFELVYSKALNEKVTAAMGVAPVILSFARFVKRKYGKKPGELWNVRALFCTSVRKIQFKYAPKLKKYFGEVPVIEIYSATEGVFAQQIDDLPYVTPNYDKYLFEVATSRGLKMLHELRKGEWGRLIVSSCMFPRYDIGDMVESMGKNYFRIFGRAKTLHILEHRLYRLLFGWFL
jgi:hypothetical protein